MNNIDVIHVVKARFSIGGDKKESLRAVATSLLDKLGFPEPINGRFNKRYETRVTAITMILNNCGIVFAGNLYGFYLPMRDSFYNKATFLLNGKKTGRYGLIVVKGIITKLEESGFINVEKGSWGEFGDGRVTTMILPDDSLRGWMYRFGIEFKHDPPCSTVTLRDENKQDTEYEMTKEIEGIVIGVELYNNYIKDCEIRLNSIKLPPAYMNRIFSRKSFKLGGRFYAEGGNIQNLPLHERKKLTIDGSNVVSLDYKHLHPSLLYEDHVDVFGDKRPVKIRHDVYSVDEPEKYFKICVYEHEMVEEELNHPLNPIREVMKKAMLIALNCRNKRSAINALAKEVASDPYLVRLLESPDYGLIMDYIEQDNSAIAYAFFNDFGVKLQYLDSQIMQHILDTCVNMDVPVIPIHDEIVCKEDDEPIVMRAMEHAYLTVMGSNVNCKVERK